MNLQKINLIKDRKIIVKQIIEICQTHKVNVKKIALVGEVSEHYITFYIFCDEKNEKRFSKNFFKIQTPNCGKCYYIVKTFNSLRNDLLKSENNWSDDKCVIIFDMSNKYKNVIKNPKKSIWNWFKNLF